MSSSPLSNFTTLDGLTQLIYQGPSRFVFLSALDVAHRHWSVYLGLAGADGRWWRGRWEKADVLKLAVREFVSYKLRYVPSGNYA